MSLSTIDYRPHPDALAADPGGGETLVMHLETSQYYCLNDTATFVWRMIERGARAAEVGPAMAREYEVTAGQAHEHAARILRELEDLRLLERVQ